jgi:hypothetical protein
MILRRTPKTGLERLAALPAWAGRFAGSDTAFMDRPAAFRPRRSTPFRRAAASVLSALLALGAAVPPEATALPAARRSAPGERAAAAAAFTEAVRSSGRELDPLFGAYQLSSQTGRVVETHFAAASGAPAPVLLHIQDAHGVAGAQRNAAEMLAGLAASGDGPLLVLQEGGTGPAETDWLAAFPFEDVKREVAGDYLRDAKITGEEYAALVHAPGAFRLVGIEDPELFRRNLDCRRSTADPRRRALAHTAAVQSRLDAVKQKAFDPRLWEADRRLSAAARAGASFIDLLREAVRLAPFPVRESEYPAATAALRAWTLESRLDRLALEAERARLLELLASRLDETGLRGLAALAVDMRLGRTSPAAFHEALLARAADLRRAGADAPVEQLSRYVDYLKTADGIDHEALLAEGEGLQDRVLAALATDDRSRRLLDLDARLRLETEFWGLALAPDRYALYLRRGPVDWPAAESYLAAEEAALRIASTPSAPRPAWAERRLDVQNYYQLALQRDAVLARRAAEELRRSGARRAVVVAGGFHTPGLTRLWRRQGFHFAVLQPRLDAAPDAPALRVSRRPGYRRETGGVREPTRLGVDLSAPMPGSVTKGAAADMSLRATVDLLGPDAPAARDAKMAVLRRWWDENEPLVRIRARHVSEEQGGKQVALAAKVDGQPIVFLFDFERGTSVLITDGLRLEGRSLDDRFAPLLDDAGVLDAVRDLPLADLAEQGSGLLVQPVPGHLTDDGRRGAELVRAAEKEAGDRRGRSSGGGWLGFFSQTWIARLLIVVMGGEVFLGALPASAQQSAAPSGYVRTAGPATTAADTVTLEQAIRSIDSTTPVQIRAEDIRRGKKFHDMMNKKLFVDLIAGYRLAPGKLPHEFSDPTGGTGATALPRTVTPGDILLREMGGSLLGPESLAALRRWDARRRDPTLSAPTAPGPVAPLVTTADAAKAGVPADAGKVGTIPVLPGGPRTDLGVHRYLGGPQTSPATSGLIDYLNFSGAIPDGDPTEPWPTGLFVGPNTKTKPPVPVLMDPAVQSWLAGQGGQLVFSNTGGISLVTYSDSNGNGRIDPGEALQSTGPLEPESLATLISALASSEGMKLFLEDTTVVFRGPGGKRHTRLDLVQLSQTPEGMQAAAVLAWYAGFALHSEVRDGRVVLKITDANGRPVGTPAAVEIESFLKLQVAISQLEGAQLFLNDRTIVFRNKEGKEYTRVDLVALLGTPGGAEAALVLGWHAGLALQSTLNPDGTVTIRFRDAEGRPVTPPASVDLDTFLKTQVAISQLTGVKLSLNDTEIVFVNAAGQEYTRLDLLKLAATPEGMEAAAILGWYAGLALNSTGTGSTVTLRLLDDQGRPVTAPTTVNLDAFLRTQVAISRLEGSQLFLDGKTVVFKNRQGREFTRMDLLATANTPAGAEAALVLGWYAGLALHSKVNTDGTVTLNLTDKDGKPLTTPATVNLNTFLKTQVAISELGGARLFLEGTQIVFRNAEGREFTRIDLLALAGTAEGAQAAAVLGWYAGLALVSTVNDDGTVTFNLVTSTGRSVTPPRSVDLDTFLRAQVAISELPGARLFLEGTQVVYRNAAGREFTRVDLVRLSGAPGGAEASAILSWYAGLSLRSVINPDGTVSLRLLDDNGKPIRGPINTDLDTLLRIQVAISQLEGATLFLSGNAVVFRNADGREFTRVDLLALAGSKSPLAAQASLILGWYAGLALNATVGADGKVTLRLKDEQGRALPTPPSIDLDVFLRTQTAISELAGAVIYLDDKNVVFRNRDGKEFTRLDLMAVAGATNGAWATALLGWYAGLALQSTVNADGTVTLRILDDAGVPVTPPLSVDLDTFLRTQAAVSELPGARLFVEGGAIVFTNAKGEVFTRFDLVRLAGPGTSGRAAEAAVVLGWYAGLALNSVLNADGTVTLRLLDENGRPVATPTTVDLDTFLRIQVAISELPGAKAYLDDNTVVYRTPGGREYTRFDLVQLASKPNGAWAAAVLGWYAGLALQSTVNADNTVTLRLFDAGGRPVGAPATVDLETFLKTQVAISELQGVQLFLDDKFIVFRDRDGKNLSRLDLLALAAKPEGAKAVAILGWYAGLAMNAVVNPDKSVTLRLTDKDGNPVTPPQTVDLDAFLRIQVAISELPGAKVFLDDKTVVFTDAQGRAYTRVDLLALAGTPEGTKAAAILGWYAGLSLQSRLHPSGRVSLVLTDAAGNPVTPPSEVDLDLFLRTQAAISQLYGVKLFLDDKAVVFRDASGREYTRVNLIELSGVRGADGKADPQAVMASAVLGWYAGLAVRSVMTPQGLSIQLYRDNNKNGRFDDASESVVPPAEIDLSQLLTREAVISQTPGAIQLLSNEVFRQLLTQANDASRGEDERRQANAALASLSSWAARSRIATDGRMTLDLTGRLAESVRINDYLLLQDFIVKTASFQRMIDPRAAAVLKGRNILQLMELAGDDAADPFARSEAQRALGIAAFFAGLASQTVDTDGDGVPDDVLLRLATRGGGQRDLALREGERPVEMLLKDFLDSYSAILNLEEFKRVLNEGGDLSFTDRQGRRLFVPREAMLASTFFGNYGAVTSGLFFRLFGLDGVSVDRDGDGAPDDGAVTRFDLLTLDDPRLQSVNAIAVFLSVNRQDLEAETGLGIGEILARIARAQGAYADYVARAFRRDVALTEGDFFFLLYLQREASARKTDIESLLFEPRARAEVMLRYQLYDTDVATQLKALRWANKQLEIALEIERLEQVLHLSDLFLDLRSARLAADRAGGLAVRLAGLRAETVTRIKAGAERDRAVFEVDRRLAEARRQATEARGRVRAAEDAVKRLLKWPADKPATFDLDPAELEGVLRAAGVERLATLRRQLADAKAEQAKSSVPERFRTEASLGGAVDLARALGVKALGPMYAFNFLMTAGVFDPQRGHVRDAAMWAYARAVVESEEARRREEAEGTKAAADVASLDGRAEALVGSVSDLKARLDAIERDFAAAKATTADWLGALADLDQALAQLEAVLRQRDGHRKDAVQFRAPFTPVQAPRASAGQQVTEAVGTVLEVASNPFSLLLAPIYKAKDRARLEGIKDEVLRTDARAVRLEDPSVEELFQAARERHPRFRQARAYEREREALLGATQASGLPKFHLVYRYFSAVDPQGLNPQPFSNLFTSGEFSAGIGVSWALFDPGKSAKTRLEQIELEKADLQAAMISSEVYLALAAHLETMDRLLAARPAVEDQLRNLEQRLEDLREFQRFNQYRDPEALGLELRRARLQDELDALDARLHTLEVDLRRLAGLGDADKLEFSENFTAKDLSRRVALQRFSAYLQESQGRIRLNDEGRGVTTSLQGSTEEAAQWTTLLSAREIKALASRAGDRTRAREIDRVIDEMNRTREGVMSWATKVREFDRLRGRLAELGAGIPGADKDVNLALLQELAARLAEIRAVAARTDLDPLTQLGQLSELAVYLTAVHASLSPDLKWNTPEGSLLQDILGAWDKALLGRYDPYLAQRLAIKNAEAHQLRASAANAMEPLVLNLDFVTLFSTRDGAGPRLGNSLTSYFQSQALTFVRVPPKLVEHAFWPVHKLVDASHAGEVPLVGTLLRELVPGLKSRDARKATVEENLQAAVQELARAQKIAVDVQNARRAAAERHTAAVQWRELAKARLDGAAPELPPAATLEQSAALKRWEAERLAHLLQYGEARSQALEAELALLALGVQPESVPVTVNPLARPTENVGPDAARAAQARLAELDRLIARARQDYGRAMILFRASELSLGWKRLNIQLFGRAAPTPVMPEVRSGENASGVEPSEGSIQAPARRWQDLYSRWVESELLARLHETPEGGTPGATPDDVLRDRLLRERYRRDAGSARLALAALEAEARAALGGAGIDFVRGALAAPGGGPSADEWTALLGRLPDGSGSAEARRLAAQIREKRMERIDIALRYVVPTVNVDLQRNEFARTLEVQLSAAWRLIGAGTGAQAGMNQAERAALERRLEQALYDARSGLARQRDDLVETARALESVDAELRDLAAPARLEELRRAYADGATDAADVASHLSRVARLSGERAYLLVRFAGLHGRLARDLAAYQAGLPPLPDLRTTPAGPTSAAATDSVVRTPDGWLGAGVIDASVSRGTPASTVMPLRAGTAGRAALPPHQRFGGTAAFRASVEQALRDADVPATDAHLLNVDDWAALVDGAAKTYRMTSDDLLASLWGRAFARVSASLKDADREGDLPEGLAVYATPVVDRLSPGLREALASRGADPNLLAKLGLSLQYAFEMRDAAAQGRLPDAASRDAWLAARADADRTALTAGLRERRGQLLSPTEQETVLRWVRQNAETAQRLMLGRFTRDEQLAYVRAARAAAERMFPGYLALVADVRDADPELSALADMADLQPGRLYLPLITFALSRGLSADDLAALGGTAAGTLPTEVRALLGRTEVRRLAQSADAQRLRYLLQRLEEADKLRRAGDATAERRSAAEADVRRLTALIELETAGERHAAELKTALFWLDRFLAAPGQGATGPSLTASAADATGPLAAEFARRRLAQLGAGDQGAGAFAAAALAAWRNTSSDGNARRFGVAGSLAAGLAIGAVATAAAALAAAAGTAALAAFAVAAPLGLYGASRARSRAGRSFWLGLTGIWPAFAAAWFAAALPLSIAWARLGADASSAPEAVSVDGVAVSRSVRSGDRRLIYWDFSDEERPLRGRTEVLARLPDAVLRSLVEHEVGHGLAGRRGGRWGSLRDESRAFLAQALALSDAVAPAGRRTGLAGLYAEALSRRAAGPAASPAATPAAALVRIGAYLSENVLLKIPLIGPSLAEPWRSRWRAAAAGSAPAEGQATASATDSPTEGASGAAQALRAVLESVRGAGLLYSPPAEKSSAGRSLFIDARGARLVDGEWKIDRVVGRALFLQLRSLQELASSLEEDEPFPVRVDFLADADFGRGLSDEEQAAAWNSLLADLGSLPGVGEDLIRRLRRAPFRLTNLRGEAAPRAVVGRLMAARVAQGYRDIQVVTGDADFWRGLRVANANIVLLVATVRDLVNVSVDVVFTGDSARLLRSYIERLPDGNDVLRRVSDGEDIRFEAVHDAPALEQLEDEEKRIRLFNIQA